MNAVTQAPSKKCVLEIVHRDDAPERPWVLEAVFPDGNRWSIISSADPIEVRHAHQPCALRAALQEINNGPPSYLPNDEVATWAGEIAGEALRGTPKLPQSDQRCVWTVVNPDGSERGTYYGVEPGDAILAFAYVHDHVGRSHIIMPEDGERAKAANYTTRRYFISAAEPLPGGDPVVSRSGQPPKSVMKDVYSELIRIAAHLARGIVNEPVIPQTAPRYARTRVATACRDAENLARDLAVRLRMAADKLSAAMRGTE